MTAAPTRLTPKLNLPPTTPLRLLGSSISQSPRLVGRYLPGDASKFFETGRLSTTRENADFLVHHGIEPDNGRMTRFPAGPQLAAISMDFKASFAFSPRHVIHPYDLHYFDPGGHPLAAMKRAEYARKARDQPLWIMLTTLPDAPNVVRTLTQRRLASALHRALEVMGYNLAPGLGLTKEIRGTLWVTLHNPVAAASQSRDRFGEAVAEALEAQCSQRIE